MESTPPPSKHVVVANQDENPYGNQLIRFTKLTRRIVETIDSSPTLQEELFVFDIATRKPMIQDIDYLLFVESVLDEISETGKELAQSRQ